MSASPQKLTSPLTNIIDAILVIAFFVYMFFVLKSHVPSPNPKMVMLWAALSSACMTGVFWLCIHMCRLVYRAQRVLEARDRR